MNFRPISYIETLPTTAGLFKRRGDFTETFESGPAKLMDLRIVQGEEDAADSTMFKDWPNAKNLLARIQRIIQGASDIRPIIGGAYIELLPPKKVKAWSTWEGDYAAKHERFHLPLVTNPLSCLYCGAESLHIPVGHLFWVNEKTLHSAVNLGDHPRFHLVVDMRKTEIET
jgi:hypothetical protein